MSYLFKQTVLISLIAFLILPAVCSAAMCGSPAQENHLELCYPTIAGKTLRGDAPLVGGTTISELVEWLYYFIIYIAGLSAFLMLILAGFEWLTSAGNPSAIGNAKDRAFNAVFGLILIFASYLIIQIINPELLTLRLPALY